MKKKKYKYVNIGKGYLQEFHTDGKPIAKPYITYSVEVHKLDNPLIQWKSDGGKIFVQFTTFKNKDKGKEVSYGGQTWTPKHDYDLVAKYELELIEETKTNIPAMIQEDDIPY